jgi:leucyl aminopeptidase (aminopeptidase T)
MAHRLDPFPIPGYSGSTPTHGVDWAAMARLVVRQVLDLQQHERVIVSANPYFAGAMLDEIRAEIQRARAIELATILHWTPGLTPLRTPAGRKPDAADARAEDRAMRELFALADVLIWLPHDARGAATTYTAGQSESVLETWRGRSVHFHWFHDPNDPDPENPVNRALDLVYQDAILNLDYGGLRRTMTALTARLADAEIRVTNAAGTDLRFRTTTRFHRNEGDASRGRVAEARSPRDREEEIPCGALRTIPVGDSVEGVLAFDRPFGYPAAGYGLPLDSFMRSGLRLFFRGGRIVRLETGGDQAALDAGWAAETGDKDRLGEMVLGCNPRLRPVPGSGFQPYYGFGAGVLRLTIGENIESGGQYRSSLHRWLMLLDATIAADGHVVVQDGRLVIAS